MLCPRCGVANQETAEYCFSCGQGLFSVTEGTLLSGRYQILQPLGMGGMGMVYKALDRELEETVAVKLLRPEFARSSSVAQRFRSEIKLARKVRHPNVCGIHEYGQDGDRRYIVMEFVQGRDLKQMVRQQGRLDPQVAYELSIQIANGLQAIHEAGIVHRDLKTPNIMLDGSGSVRLMDFGIAKLFETDAGPTRTGDVVGTPEYMSPEQALAQHIDVRSDVYAMGVVVFELFTGKVPFKGENPMATMLMQIQQPPPLDDPPGAPLPELLKPILARMLAKDREQRFASCRDVAGALRAARAEGSLASPTPVDTAGAALAERMPAADLRLPTPVPADVPTPVRTRVLTPRETTPGTDPTVLVGGRAAAADTRADVAAPSRRGVFLAVGAVVVASALAALWWWPRAPGTPGPTPSALASVAAPSPFPTAPVSQAPSPHASEASPLATPSPAATPTPTPQARHSLVPTSVPTTLAARPVTPAPSAEPVGEPGLLRVIVRPYAEVSVDGRPVGTSPPLAPLSLAPGSHTVYLSHPSYRPLARIVVIRPGETTRLEVNLAQEATRP